MRARLPLFALVLAACSDDTGRFFPPDGDNTQSDATSDDVVSDIVASDAVTSDIVSTDVRPSDVVTDRGPAVDRGPNNCPSGCATSRDCAPCAERAGELFCCVSGLCVFTSETMCLAAPDGGGGGSDAGDGGADDASMPDVSGNPFDDAGSGDDGGMMPPEDVPASDPDAGMDGGASDGGSPSDVFNDLSASDGG